MLHRDIIQPLPSPWASCVVLGGKKKGSAQFVQTIANVMSTVTSKDACLHSLKALSGSRWFSTLDLLFTIFIESGYWQVEIKKTCDKQ